MLTETAAADRQETAARREPSPKNNESPGRWEARLHVAAYLSLGLYGCWLLVYSQGNLQVSSWAARLATAAIALMIVVEIFRLLVTWAGDWRLLLVQSVLTILTFRMMDSGTRLAILLLTPLLIDCFAYLPPLAATVFGAASVSVMALTTRNSLIAVLPSEANLTPILGAIAGWLVAVRARERAKTKTLLEQYKLTSAEFAEANLRLQEYANQAEYFSAMEERTRLAREIHDTLGHLLISMMVQIRACKTAMLSRPEEVGAELDILENAVQDGLHEVRGAVATLRQPRGGARGRQLWSKMAAIFAETTHMNVEVEIADDFLGLEEEVELTTYRIIQEGLTNAYRHGRAGRCRIKIWEYDGYLVIHISDNGDGASTVEEGFGLRGMRERVEALGGEIAYRYQLGRGFDIGAQIPLRGGERHG